MTVRVFRFTLLAALVTFAVAACGVRANTSTTASATQAPASTPLSVSNASGWTVSARAQTVGAGPTTVAVIVTVKGPATVYGGCESPVSVEFLNAQGQPVNTGTRTGIHCLAIAAINIPQGQSQTFSLQVPAPSGSGPYSIRATVNSKPQTALPDLKFG